MQQNTKSLQLLAAVFATGLMSLSGVVSETAMNVTFPSLMTAFGVTTSTVQWLTTGYLLALALVVPLSSFLKQRFLLRALFLTANLLFFAATILCALAPYFSVLLTGRLIQGVATGIALPLMFNIILTQAPKSKLGLLIGIASMITAIAPAIGPVLGGILVDAYGWRVIFWVLVPVLALSLALGLWAVRQAGEPDKTATFPLTDYVLLSVGFITFVLATEQLSHRGITMWLLFAVSAAVLAYFVRRSQKKQHVLLRLSVFRYRAFVYSMLFVLLIQFCVLALGYLIPNYSQIVGGESAHTAGMLLFPGCLIGAVMSPFAGQLLDRFGAIRPVLGGGVIIIVAMLLFSLCASGLTTPQFMLIYSIYACGQGLAVGNAMTHGLGKLPTELSADGNAVLNTLQQLSGAIGTSISASIVAAAQSAVPDALAQGTLNGSRYAFFLITVLAVAAFFCAWRGVREN